MIINKYKGQGGGGVAGVSSLNGKTGALTTKTINGNDILGSGDITIEGGAAQYDLDAMTQAERAEFVAMCENLTDEERRLLFVYRDGVICTFDHTEGSGDSFKIGFFDTRNDGWSYTTTKYRHFFVKADGSYEESGYAAFPEIITYDTNYSDTSHALSSSDNFSPLNAISNLNAGQDGKVALNLRLIIQSNPAKIVLSSKAWSERIDNLEGKIGAEWHYNGNVITAVWNVVEHNATIETWAEVPEGGSSEISLEYNQIREIEHKDYVSYTFKYTPETSEIWHGTNYEAQLFTVTYNGNSYTVFAQLNRNDPYAVFGQRGGNRYYYSTGGASSPSQANAYFSRPIDVGTQIFTNLPDLYVEVYDDGDSYNWIFAVPQDYSVNVDVETYTGLGYIGTGALDFVEIAPGGAILLANDTIALPIMEKFKAYILTHYKQEEFDIRTTSQLLRGSGEVILKAISYEPSNGNAYRQIGLVFAETENLTFWYKSWFGNSLENFLGGKKKAGAPINFVKFGTTFYYNPDTNEFTYNESVLSDNTVYNNIIDWGIFNFVHQGGENISAYWVPTYTITISGSTDNYSVSQPSTRLETLSSPVTIGGAQFTNKATLDYGEWVLSCYINGNNDNANFKMYRRKKVENISQSDYDALVQAGTVDANTLYVII